MTERSSPIVNQPPSHLPPRVDAQAQPDPDTSPPSSVLPVGDVVIRRDDTGYGIFNYRGERVLELPVRTSAEAARLAADIVSPWHGCVRIDPSLGD